MKPINADRYLTRRWPVGTEIIYYVRPAGDDDNDGLTALTAFATLERALHFMAVSDLNLSIIVDVTGMTGASAITANAILNLGGNTLGGISYDLDLAATAPDNFFSKASRQIRSETVKISDVNVTAQTFNATTGLLTLTVSDALVLNALRGNFAVGSGLGEYGAIVSNSGGAGPNTIEVANTLGMTLPVTIRAPGATLRFGDAGNAFEQAIYLNALCDWSLQGLTIETNGPKTTAINIWAQAPVVLTLCEIKGMTINAGAGLVTVDGCYLNGQYFGQNGGDALVIQSVFSGVTFACHGSGAGGLNEWLGVHLVGCGAFGDGNTESHYTFQIANMKIDAGTEEGLFALFGISSISHVIIQNCLKSAIIVRNSTTLNLTTVTGTGNIGYGIELRYGAIVIPVAATVTGTTNDLFVGALGAVAWASIPLTDLDQLVRIGV